MRLTQECVDIYKSSDCTTKPSANPFLLAYLETPTQSSIPSPNSSYFSAL